MKLLPQKSKAPLQLTNNRVGSAAGFLFGAWKARPRSRRVLYALSVLMVVSGTAMVTWPIATDIISTREQDRLRAEFSSPTFLSDFQAGSIEPGRVLTRIIVPRIGVDALVVEGTDARALRAGAGHYSASPLPCEAGNVSIAGHRSTYGKPFSRFDELRVGDEVVLVTPDRRCRYRVVDGPRRSARPLTGAAGWITHPADSAVIGPMEGSWLTLTTCHPKGSAAKRLIVRAELISVA